MRKWVRWVLFLAGAWVLLCSGSLAASDVGATGGFVGQPDTILGDTFIVPDTVYPSKIMKTQYECTESSFLPGSFPDSLWTWRVVVKRNEGFRFWIQGTYTPPITLVLVDCYLGSSVEIAKLKEWRQGRAGYTLLETTEGDGEVASGIYVLSLVAGDTTLAVPIFVNASVAESTGFDADIAGDCVDLVDYLMTRSRELGCEVGRTSAQGARRVVLLNRVDLEFVWTIDTELAFLRALSEDLGGDGSRYWCPIRGEIGFGTEGEGGVVAVDVGPGKYLRVWPGRQKTLVREGQNGRRICEWATEL